MYIYFPYLYSPHSLQAPLPLLPCTPLPRSLHVWRWALPGGRLVARDCYSNLLQGTVRLLLIGTKYPARTC